MIAYLAIPFAFGDLGSINAAMRSASKHSSLFMKHNKGSVLVNPLFSVYNSDQLTKVFSEQEYYIHAKVLIDAASTVIVLTEGNWEYSEVTKNELGYAYFRGKSVHFLEPVTNEQELHRDNKDSNADGM